MKQWWIVMLAAVPLALALEDHNSAPQEETRWEQGVQRVDGYLDDGVVKSRHEMIEREAEDSVEWASDVGNDITGIIK